LRSLFLLIERLSDESWAVCDEKLVPEAAAEEIEKLQGTWKQIAYEKDGVTESLDEFGWEPRVTFTGDTFVVTLADGSIAIKGSSNSIQLGSPRLSTGWISSARMRGKLSWPSTPWRATD